MPCVTVSVCVHWKVCLKCAYLYIFMNDNNNYVSTLCEIMFVFMLIGKPGHACKTTSVCENICICTLSLSLSLFFPSLSPSLSLSLSLSFSVCVCLSVCTCYISTTYIQTGKNTHPLLNHLMKFVLLHQSKTFLHYYL